MVTKKRNSIEMNSEKKTTKKVNFAMVAPSAKNVFLAGDFNNWV